jgi:hypothetical protein
MFLSERPDVVVKLNPCGKVILKYEFFPIFPLNVVVQLSTSLTVASTKLSLQSHCVNGGNFACFNDSISLTGYAAASATPQGRVRVDS